MASELVDIEGEDDTQDLRSYLIQLQMSVEQSILAIETWKGYGKVRAHLDQAYQAIHRAVDEEARLHPVD